MVTHKHIQDLIGGAVRQEGLPGGAADLIGSAVREHGAPPLVPPGPVDGPVPIDDRSPSSTPEGWERERERERESITTQLLKCDIPLKQQHTDQRVTHRSKREISL